MSACLVQAVPFVAPPSAAQERRGRLAECLASVAKLSAVTAASRLEVRGAPERAPSGNAELDALTGGLPRGCLSQICGGASSGRTSFALAALAAATARGEVCALVDASDAFDPESGAAAGMDFDKLLWIRCSENATRMPARERENRPMENRLEQALRAVDLLLQSGGFGLVVMDFSDIPHASLRRIPLASWFRFQRVLEPTPTIILILAQVPCAASCSSLLLELQPSPPPVAKPPARAEEVSSAAAPPHAELFSGLQIRGELQPCRGERKPPQPVRTRFQAAALRTG